MEPFNGAIKTEIKEDPDAPPSMVPVPEMAPPEGGAPMPGEGGDEPKEKESRKRDRSRDRDRDRDRDRGSRRRSRSRDRDRDRRRRSRDRDQDYGLTGRETGGNFIYFVLKTNFSKKI